MGMGWHEWPLMIFTVLGQFVAGGFILMSLVLLSGKIDEAGERRIRQNMFFLWALMAIAILASIMHLGSPMRAFNSLNRIGHSALSNEIAAAGAFFAVGGLFWLANMLTKMSDTLNRIWLCIGIVFAVVFIYATCKVYEIETVPTWYSGYTYVSFILTALIGGPLLAYLLIYPVVAYPRFKTLALLGTAAVLVSMISSVMQITGLSQIHSSVQQASQLIPDLGPLTGVRFVCLLLGVGCWICPLIRGKKPAILALICGLVLLLVGELIGRGVFYGLHMTVGMAIGG